MGNPAGADTHADTAPTDMASLKATAAHEGIPYQTLVTSILHKYVTGALIDRNTVKKIIHALRVT